MKLVRNLMVVTGVLLAIAPFVAWAAFKPVRILAPTLNGVTCVANACVDDLTQLPRVQRIQLDAITEVGRNFLPLDQTPLTVFCSTRDCYRSFGGGMERGATILNLGVILPPESWVAHIVEHEYIHMLQAQQLGLFGQERTPDWFKEGLPFLVSDPPPHDLPAYARPLVSEYQAWERRVGRANIWQAVKDI